MIIPIGTMVKVIRNTDPINFNGCVAPVTGYGKYPPTCITRLILTRPGDIMFKYPHVFPWEVEIVPEVEEPEA